MDPLSALGLIGAARGLLGGGRTEASQSKTDFAKILEDARAGKLESGRSISIAGGVDLDLSREQLDRLAAAADLAEREGTRQGVFLIDGQALRMDVDNRTITAVLDPGSTMNDIDSVMSVPDEGAPAPAAPLGLPNDIEPNSTLLDVLAAREASRQDAAA